MKLPEWITQPLDYDQALIACDWLEENGPQSMIEMIDQIRVGVRDWGEEIEVHIGNNDFHIGPPSALLIGGCNHAERWADVGPRLQVRQTYRDSITYEKRSYRLQEKIHRFYVESTLTEDEAILLINELFDEDAQEHDPTNSDPTNSDPTNSDPTNSDPTISNSTNSSPTDCNDTNSNETE